MAHKACTDGSRGPSGQVRGWQSEGRWALVPPIIALKENYRIICELAVVQFDVFMDSDLDLIFE